MKVPGQHEERYCALLVLGINKWHCNGIHRQLVPADGSCLVPYAGIGFHVSHTMGHIPNQRAAFKFCSPDMLFSRVGGCSGKIYIKKLMLSMFSETR